MFFLRKLRFLRAQVAQVALEKKSTGVLLEIPKRDLSQEPQLSSAHVSRQCLLPEKQLGSEASRAGMLNQHCSSSFCLLQTAIIHVYSKIDFLQEFPLRWQFVGLHVNLSTGRLTCLLGTWKYQATLLSSGGPLCHLPG